MGFLLERVSVLRDVHFVPFSMDPGLLLLDIPLQDHQPCYVHHLPTSLRDVMVLRVHAPQAY